MSQKSDFATHGSLTKLQADRERCRIAVGRCRWSQHESIAATAENPIMLISRGALSIRGIGRISMNTICQSIVEVQLRRELEAPLGHRRGANLEMNVYGPACIPAWVYSDEPSLAARVGYLIAT